MTLGAVALVALAYLGGAIPFGYLAGRLSGIDIRTHGSGNTGATNVWRALGPRVGFPVFVLDLLKGFVPAAIGLHLGGAGLAVIAGAAAIIGHTWPVFLGFGGGKGVATAGGVGLAVAPLALLCLPPIFLAILWLTRYVSLASMTVTCLFPVLALAFGIASPALSMLGWRALLADLGSPLHVAPASGVFLVGQLGKYLPGSVWSVLAQAEIAGQQRVDNKPRNHRWCASRVDPRTVYHVHRGPRQRVAGAYFPRGERHGLVSRIDRGGQRRGAVNQSHRGIPTANSVGSPPRTAAAARSGWGTVPGRPG